MYFTHRKVFTNDPSKKVYTVMVDDTTLGRVCGKKGCWQVLGTSGLGTEVYPTRDAAGAVVAAGAVTPKTPAPTRLKGRDRIDRVNKLEENAWNSTRSRVRAIIWEYGQPKRVAPPDDSMGSIESAAQWSAQLTRVAVGMIVELLQVLVEEGVLTEEQVEEICKR